MGTYLKKRRRDDGEEKKWTKKARTMGPYRRAAPRTAIRLLSTLSEAKGVDIPATTQSISSTFARQLCNGIIPGNGINNRQGRAIKMKNFQLRGQIIQTQNGTSATNDFLRIMLVYDKQANGANFSGTDLLSNVDNAGNITVTPFSAMNLSNSKRFKVLKSWCRTSQNNASSVPNMSKDNTDFLTPTTLNWFVDLKGLDTQYNAGVAGTIADIQTGSLYLVFFGINASADLQNSVRYETRLRYFDA